MDNTGIAISSSRNDKLRRNREKGVFPNLFMSGDIDVHEGNYALNIKQYGWGNPNFKDDEQEDAIEHVTSSFFYLIHRIVKSFGFDDFTTGGRSGGWIYLVTSDGQRFKTIQAVTDDEINFDEYFLQERVFCVFNCIKDIKSDLMSIYRNSNSYDEMTTNIERYIYG